MIPYIPSQKEFDAVSRLDIDRRVKHFVSRVAGHCYLWLCVDNGELLLNYDRQNNECLLVWPAKKYAELVIKTDDLKYLSSLELHDFLDQYIGQLINHNIQIFVFPNKELNGALMTAESFKNMMEEELDRME